MATTEALLEKRHADLDEVEALRIEGVEIVNRIAKTLNASGDLDRYAEIRKSLWRFMDRAAGFPIPPESLAARSALNAISARAAEKIAPILKK